MTSTRATPPTSPPSRGTPGRFRRFAFRCAAVTAACTAVFVAGSCVHIPISNPAYAVDDDWITDDLQRMRDNPTGLQRPLIVLSGYRSPVHNARDLAGSLVELTGADTGRVVHIAYQHASTIEDPAQRVIDLVDETFPSDDPIWTTEVDIAAISMGGLVARVASEDPSFRGKPGGRRLSIANLYTVGTPHNGANLAQVFQVDPASTDMRPGSRFLAGLNGRKDYERYNLVPYAALQDRLVGATRCAPPGMDPIWTPGRAFGTHFLLVYEDRILADLARRLRGEEPIAAPSPPPRD